MAGGDEEGDGCVQVAAWSIVMAITDWPEDERPREKLLARGAQALSDAELLAIFLRTGQQGLTAVDLARRQLVSSGGLRAMLDLSPERMAHLPGMGVARRALLLAALELGRRYLAEPLERGLPLDNPDKAGQLLTAQLRGLPFEVFACLFLDNKHRLIAFEKLFQGTIDAAAVYPREVVRRAMEHNAAAVILAHNHPSGVAEPSQSDHAITRRLVEALGLVEVRVLDHLVIGDGGWVSLASRGAV
ncbi:MAG: DNA repair protein RadC [Alcanivorax borkumensis]